MNGRMWTKSVAKPIVFNLTGAAQVNPLVSICSGGNWFLALSKLSTAKPICLRWF